MFSKTGIKENTNTLICGSAGSGKTCVLINFIMTCSGTFDKIYLCCSCNEPIYDLLKKNYLIEVFTIEDFPTIDEFEYSSSETSPKYLVVFDCIIPPDFMDKIQGYFGDGCQKNITIMYLSQCYQSTPKIFRDQLQYLILTSIPRKIHLKIILEEYKKTGLTIDTILDVYKSIKENNTDNLLEFLKIDLKECCPKNKKLSRNFLEYLTFE